MNIALFEDTKVGQLLPLTWLRAAFELVCGRDKLIDKIRRHIGSNITGLWVRDLVRPVVWDRFAFEVPQRGADWLLLNARTLVTADVTPPPAGTAWYHEGCLVGATVRSAAIEKLDWAFFQDVAQVDEWLRDYRREPLPEGVRLIDHPWQLALANDAELRRQLTLGGSRDGQIYTGAHLMNPEQIRIAAGAVIKPGVVLDAEDGPIHIAEDAVIEPNAVVQGPCYVGPKSVVRPGATIRAGTTIGPVCKVGGEIEATIFQGYANKQHDGFLGHSYVCPWVNLGADTVTSDLKNTYGTIRVNINGVGIETGERFVGSIIGDHAKTGIGTILPTGCVVGIVANVFTQGSVPKFVPSFAWLTGDGLGACRVDKALEIAATVMSRRDKRLSEPYVRLLRDVAAESRNIEAAGWNQAPSS